MRKKIRMMLGIIESLVLACLGVFILFLLSASSQSVISYIVMSGSMEPVIQTGSLIFIDEKVSAAEIRVGDIIGYHSKNGSLILHRVVAIEDRKFITKGDNNETNDFAPVELQQYIGLAKGVIPYVGYAVNSLKDIRVLFFLSIGAVVYIYVMHLLNAEKKEGDRK